MSLSTTTWILIYFTAVLQLTCSQFVGPPRFVNFMDNFSLDETEPVGSIVYTLFAEGNGPIKYYIKQIDAFRVDEDSGNVTLVRQLDYESGEITLTLELLARDPQGLTDEVSPTINILDANDNAPVFRRRTYQQRIPEDFTVNTDVISNLEVNDVDFRSTGQRITVTCDPDATGSKDTTTYQEYVEACNTFTPVQQRSGNREWLGYIELLKALDYETRSTYQLPLVTFDGQNKFLQSFEILLTDVNDAPPKFILVPEVLFIEENIRLRSVIGRVVAIDGDRNNPRDIRYNTTFCPALGSTRKDADSVLNIDYVTGEISTKGPIDRENELFLTGLQLCIKASEIIDNETGLLGNDPETTATTTIRIDVNDLNDQTPSFDSNSYTTSIYEDIADGTAIPGVALTVTDLDGFPANSYSIELINYKDIFEAFPANGSGRNIGGITVKDTTQIDYEAGPRQFQLYVIARENRLVDGSFPNTGTTTVTINVLDLNDNTPTFSRPLYNVSVYETDPGFQPFIKNLRATDPDSGSMGTTGILYRLLGSEYDLFRIEPTNIGAAAQMYVDTSSCVTPGRGRCLDYERRHRYDFTVVAEDEYANPGGRTGTSQIIINIIDENDSVPVFELNSYVGNIRENEINTVNPLFVTAKDADTVGRVTYSMVDSPQAKYWQIDTLTGFIRATEPIFYSFTPGERGWFELSVVANDTVNEAITTVRINVIDLNNFAPIFDNARYQTDIPEDTLGDAYVMEISASDADSSSTDNGRVKYNIRSGAQGRFVIDQDSGIITTASDATFDYDLQDKYELTVLARDGGNPQLTGTSTVIINILDKNNKLPYFKPEIQRASVVENEPIGYLVTTVTAVDPDKDAQLTFTMTPTGAITPDGVSVIRSVYDYTTLFSLEPTSGNIRVNSALDRDLTSVITFNMTVTDVSDPNNPQVGKVGRLIIRIREFNDQAPEFQQQVYNLTVEEEQLNGTFITVLVAQDADDDIDTYEILEKNQPYFQIQNTGVLEAKSRIDFEKTERTEFTVRATDTGVPKRSGTAKVYVTFLNINDNSPIPSLGTYTVSIPEHSPAGTSLTQITATDKDKGDYGVVRYNLTEEETRFNIDPVTGKITLAAGVVFDREDQSLLVTRVTVYDSPLDADVRRHYSVPVYVTLSDINDNSPVFGARDYVSTEIIESIDIGAQILQVFATDRDSGINAQLRYEKVPGSGDPLNLFELTPITGQILVAQSLRSRIGTYTFNITAKDLNGGFGYRIGYATVTIKVIEALNSAPIWYLPPSDNHTIEVLESQYRGMLVYDVHANDSNSGNNGIVDYFLQDAENVVSAIREFSINRITGVIRAEVVFDRETVDRYRLHLIAKDKGDPSLRAERFLNIVIADVNDNNPEFPMSNGVTIPSDFFVWENATVGTFIGAVTATDRDLAPYSDIFYKIIAGGQDKFAIDQRSGQITLAAPVDREEEDEYSLEVRATNGESDYTVITRRRRSTDPSVVTVNIRLRDVNDEPPRFVDFNGPDPNIQEYYGCISALVPYDQGVVQLSAVDRDQDGQVGLTYDLVAGNDGDAFRVDTYGMVRNKRLLDSVTQRAYSLTATATDGKWMVRAPVQVFITEAFNEVKLVINQKETDASLLRAKIASTISSLGVISYACVLRVTNHMTGRAAVLSKSDVSVIAVTRTPDGGYQLLSTEELTALIVADRAKTRIKYEDIYVEQVGSGGEAYGQEERSVLIAVFVIILLLVLLTVILMIIVCCCLKEMKLRRKRKSALVDSTTMINPVYGSGSIDVEFVKTADSEPEPAVVPEPSGDVYAVVKKRDKKRRPSMVEPVPMVGEEDTEPVIETEIVDDFDDDDPTDPNVVVLKITDNDPPSDHDDEGPVIETVIDEDAVPEPTEVTYIYDPDTNTERKILSPIQSGLAPLEERSEHDSNVDSRSDLNSSFPRTSGLFVPRLQDQDLSSYNSSLPPPSDVGEDDQGSDIGVKFRAASLRSEPIGGASLSRAPSDLTSHTGEYVYRRDDDV